MDSDSDSVPGQVSLLHCSVEVYFILFCIKSGVLWFLLFIIKEEFLPEVITSPPHVNYWSPGNRPVNIIIRTNNLILVPNFS